LIFLFFLNLTISKMIYLKFNYNKIIIEIIKISLVIISIIIMINSFIYINKIENKIKLYLKKLALDYIQIFNWNYKFKIYNNYSDYRYEYYKEI
jgi:hypothetical protein